MILLSFAISQPHSEIDSSATVSFASVIFYCLTAIKTYLLCASFLFYFFLYSIQNSALLVFYLLNEHFPTPHPAARHKC